MQLQKHLYKYVCFKIFWYNYQKTYVGTSSKNNVWIIKWCLQFYYRINVSSKYRDLSDVSKKETKTLTYVTQTNPMHFIQINNNKYVLMRILNIILK